MKIINKNEASLGLETYQDLGFTSEEELNKEIKKLIQVRSEFKANIK